MVIHIDLVANERRFVCILKCRRTKQTKVVSGWTLLRCLKGTCLWVTDMWASHLLGPHVIDTKVGALRHQIIIRVGGWVLRHRMTQATTMTRPWSAWCAYI